MAYKISLPAEKDKTRDNFPIPGHVLDYILPEENDGVDIRTKGQDKISSKTLSSKTQKSTDTSDSGLKSKLLFVRRIPSDRIVRQISKDRSQRKYGNANQMPRYISE